MSTLVLRVLERIHGHLGWLAVAALLHPAILLRKRTRRAPLAVILAALGVTITAIFGAVIYPHYRNTLKQSLFIHTPRVGWLFERKEHLAVAALGLAWAGAIAHLSVSKFPVGEGRDAVARLSHHAFVASFVLALVTGVLGVVVASYSSF